MGGRGSSARVPYEYTYKCIGEIDGVKILEPLGVKWQGKAKLPTKLPEESHSSRAYMKLNPYGQFSQYREYDENHQIILEIGYHREATLDRHAPQVLHIHFYNPPGNFQNRAPRLLTQEEFEKYKHLFIGLKL